MKPWKHACWPLLAGVVFAGGFAGCEEPGGGAGKGGATLESRGPPPPPPLAKAAGDSTQPDVGGSQAPAVSPVTSPPAVQPRPPIAPTPSTPTAAPAIRLSAGVALPQPGPTGILMSFSVDYRFTAGGPNPTSPYVWVIERSKGKPARVPVRLRKKGTLPVLIPGWRPEQGPFQSHVEDAHGNRLSRSISLR